MDKWDTKRSPKWLSYSNGAIGTEKFCQIRAYTARNSSRCGARQYRASRSANKRDDYSAKRRVLITSPHIAVSYRNEI